MGNLSKHELWFADVQKLLWRIFQPSTSYPRPSTIYPRPSTSYTRPSTQKANSFLSRSVRRGLAWWISLICISRGNIRHPRLVEAMVSASVSTGSWVTQKPDSWVAVPWEYSKKNWVGCAAHLPKLLPFLWTKSAILPSLFMTWPKIWNTFYNPTLKSIHCLRPVLWLVTQYWNRR